VYGNLENIEKVSEETGPLLPVSSYGAGKLAAEAFISAYCSVYDLEAFIFRFGNVLGNRINHGVIWDFTGRILENPSKLKILGDGTQEKNYFLVGDCIKGMKFVTARQTRIPGKAYVFNLGNSTTTNVVEIARLVIEESGFKGASIEIEGSELAWKGDQPIIKLNCEKVKELGWTCETSSDEAVRITTRALLKVRANET
jgi:UDP-glucose 4-epimerase